MPVRMQMMFRTCRIASALLTLSACATTSELELPKTLGACDWHRLNGLSVLVYHDGKVDAFSVQGNTLEQREVSTVVLESYPDNDPGMNYRKDLQAVYAGLPRNLPTGEPLGFPAAISPNGKRWAATIISDPARLTQLVMSDGAGTVRVSSAPGFDLHSVAWSPDSSIMAIVETKTDVRIRNLRDLISPHAITYSDVLLAVHDATGGPVCRYLLMKEARYSYAKMRWTTAP
ncbi:MAG TPA: hypothetical protein VH439_10170 [Gemmatimonadales bacterium]|jgi:hypothetical protein